MFKCIHDLAPSYLSNQIIMACEVHDRNTRLTNSMDVYVPEAKTDMYKQSFQYNGAIVWNSLPVHIKNCTSLSMFKCKYKHEYVYNMLRN